MKKLITLLLLVFTISTVSAQKTYNLDASKTEKQLIGKSVKTQDVATYKAQSYSVYQTEKGKLFIVYVNKKGNYSKKYITE